MSAIKHKCDLCAREYKSRESLNRHRMLHSQIAENTCEICDATFFRKDLLLRHLRIHGLGNREDYSGDSSQVRGRQRSAAACGSCRRQKVRCFGGCPCAPCLKSNRTCVRQRKPIHLSLAASFQPSLPKKNPESTSLPTTTSDQTLSVAQQTRKPASQTSDAIRADDNPQQETLRPYHPDMSPMPNVDFFAFEDAYGTTTAGTEANVRHSLNPKPASYTEEQASLLQPDATVHSVSASTDEIAQLQYLMIPGDMDWSRDWSWVYNSPTFDHQTQSMDGGLSHHANETPTLDENSRSLHVSNFQHDEAQGRWTLADLYPVAGSFCLPIAPPGIAANAAVSNPSPHTTATLPESVETEIQRSVIEGHVEFAIANVGTPCSTEELAFRTRARREGAVKAANAFGLQNLDSLSHDSRDALDRFVSLFFQHFHPQCPLFREQSFDSYEVSPIIFLSIVSIGAHYSGPKAAHYGEMLHTRLQTLFMSTVVTQPQVQHKDIFLVFGVLITVGQLLLGKEDAFSYAQQMSSILVVQARKLGLFKSSPLRSTIGEDTADSDGLLNDWFGMEMKKRLAFTIFRIEAYLSTFFHTRPVVSTEETHIELPCPDFIWTSVGHDTRRRTLQTIEDHGEVQHYTFAELLQIALERNEPLPALDAQDHEFLLLALQEKASRFSQDPGLMCVFQPGRLMTASALRGRRMADNQSDFDRLLSALTSWKNSIPAAPPVPELRENHQRTYLRSQVVFHSIHLRLNTPTELIAQVATAGPPLSNMQPDELRKMCHWSCSSHAQVALSHAQALCSHLRQAPKDAQSIQANFDLSYSMAITQAALALWTVAGGRDRGGQAHGLWDVNQVIPEASFDGCVVNLANLGPLLRGLQTLVAELAPAWFVQPLFERKVATLLETPFPDASCLE